MTDRAPRRKKRRPKRPPGYRSPWAWLAPAALLGAVTVIVLILSSAGVIGHTSDGGLPASTLPGGTVETLPVPNTPPPPEPAPPPPPPLPPPAPPATATNTTTTTATTTGTSSSTTPSTTATTAQSTTATTTTTSTQATTTSDGQHVKWTVQRGDTLFSIATQFQTSVKELRRLNPGIDPSALQVGQTLVVR